MANRAQTLFPLAKLAGNSTLFVTRARGIKKETADWGTNKAWPHLWSRSQHGILESAVCGAMAGRANRFDGAGRGDALL